MAHNKQNLIADLFAIPDFQTIQFLRPSLTKKRIFLIGCGERKKNHSSIARDLYTSERFQTACQVAEELHSDFFILSAKHGLVAPQKTLKPYDFHVSELSLGSLKSWARKVLSEMRRNEACEFVLLAPLSYTKVITEINRRHKKPLDILTPLAEIEERHHLEWLRQAWHGACRIRDLTKLYNLIAQARDEGQTFWLNSLAAQKLPERGVYIFLDFSEKNFMGQGPRIVRIGTHAVSAGSKSSIRNRLRNHLGISDGSGNHRGSIFRLHVGRALIQKNGGNAQLDNWGVGQHAEMSVRLKEVEHEKQVSEYLGGLEVFVIPVSDEPSKTSLRAHIEMQLIALCSEKLELIDAPSPTWLGNYSPLKLIMASGLWNLRGVGHVYNVNALGSLRRWGTHKNVRKRDS